MNHADYSNQLTDFAEEPEKVFAAKLHTCLPLVPEIGQEPIRFPIVINPVEKKKNPQKLVFGYLRHESALTECPITGIVLSVGIPALPFALTYDNPIAKEKNARKIAALPQSELQAFPTDILAGVLLSLLSANSLIEDHKTGFERNKILIADNTSEILIETIQKVSKVLNALNSDRMKRFLLDNPKISLNSSGNICLTVEDWYQYVFPSEPVVPSSKYPSLKELDDIENKKKQSVTVKTPAKRNISLSMRSRIKILAKSLESQEAISKKASSIFQFLGTGANWKSLTKESKKTYIAYLAEKSLLCEESSEEEIEELLTLLKEIPVTDSYEILVEEEETVSSTVQTEASSPKILTLRERLDAIAKRNAK